MQSVDRLIRFVCFGAACVALAACSMFGDKPATPVTGAPPEAKAAPAIATGKEAAAATAKPELPISAAAQRAFDTARQAQAAGRTADAERGYVALTKSDPDLAGPYANLGLIYRQAGKTPEAVAALEKAVQLSPQRPDLHNQLGITYRMAGAFAKGNGPQSLRAVDWVRAG